jgi:SH3-like domain-containing protein
MKFLFCLFFLTNLYAFEESFASLRNGETNVRLGPSLDYPIKFVYKLQHTPIKIVGEYDNWYKIKDKDNEEGWINKNLVVKKRHLIVIDGTQIVYKNDDLESNPIFRVEKNVILEYKKCKDKWCKVEVNNKVGWVQKEVVWGT